MRKVGGVLLVLAMAVPLGMVAAPAGSATTGLTCTALGETVTWKPPVPLASQPKVKSNTTIASNVSKCKGTPKITSGKITLPVIKGKTAQNCGDLIAKPTKITQAGGKITWNNKTVSTLGLLTLTPVPKQLATYKATAKITKGQFKGKAISLNGHFTQVPKTGCVTTPLAKATLSLQAKTKAVVK